MRDYLDLAHFSIIVRTKHGLIISAQYAAGKRPISRV
jgi:hypothetical protein